MPTYFRLVRFNNGWDQLSARQQAQFRIALALFIEDLRKGSGFRPGLRVKKMSRNDVWEMSWAPYGKPVKDHDVHIVWHRIAKHKIFDEPK